jgi:transposase
MAHFHVKTKKGRPYLYVREIARVGGKPKVVSQTYIGSPERVRALVEGTEEGERRLRVEEFGALWLASQLDADVDLAALVDAVVPPGPRETGPTVGEYFLYAVWNRMVEARSKRALPTWYRPTAVQQIRPVEIGELTSERYWEKWDRVGEGALERIARRFFERIWELEQPTADCVLFDTTNYYTFMASHTGSNLAQRGKNKAGRHQLRQIGVGLLVARDSRLPLYYSVYPGNLHDSKHFEAIMDEMFGTVCALQGLNERLTVVIDKGMNADENMAWLDDHGQMHFVTSYSPYFAQDLARTPLRHFEPVDNERNRGRVAEGRPEMQILAYRTKGEYWGKERAVVVTHNPATARKQGYALEGKLQKLRTELLSMQAKVRAAASQWTDADRIRLRYLQLCKRLFLPSDLYELHFTTERGQLRMRFHENAKGMAHRYALLGKNVIITDNTDWTTAEIVDAHLQRWEVEDRFRQSKHHLLVGVQPIRHWTDSKIRCHLFTCVAAMTYLRRLELRLARAGKPRTAVAAMEDMRHLHSVLQIRNGRRKPERRLEQPTETQAEVLAAFGYRITSGGVLQAHST